MKRSAKLWIAAAALAVVAAGVFAYRGPVRAWQERRLMAIAEAQFRQRDYRSAALGARAVLQFDPNSRPAYDLLARLAANERSPAAMFWREKLVQLQPGQAAPLIELANTATALGETFIAEDALHQVPAAGQDSAAFHQAAAAWSMALRQYASAEAHFQKALELDPGNRELRLNLAIVRLALAAPPQAGAGRAELIALQNDPALRLPATRALLADARQRGDTARALELATLLPSLPGAGLTDRMLYLEELQHAQSPAFAAELERVHQTIADAGSAYAILEWLNTHGLAAKTPEWHAALPAALQTQLPEPLAVADALTLLGDWRGLRSLLNGANWGNLEFLRLAYEARIFDETTRHARNAQFSDRWERAVNSTSGEANSIAMLARLVQGWGWKGEAAQLWWLLANRSIGQRPALAALFELATAQRNTAELYRVSRRLFEIEPASPVARNNAAMHALLLQKDLPDAFRWAEENYRLDPTHPVFLSTYAFALYRQNRAREAADLLAKLPEKELTDPSIAACYGAALAAAGEKEKAAPFLELARKEKARLLPEEEALLGPPPSPAAP